MIAFNQDQLASFWHRYQHGLVGLTNLTYSSVISWDAFLDREAATYRKEQSWLSEREKERVGSPAFLTASVPPACGGCVD